MVVDGQERRALEPSRQPGDDAVAVRRRARREGPAVAPKHVRAGGPAEGLVAEHELALAVDLARHDARRGLRVDAHRVLAVPLPHLLNVRLKVACEAGARRVAVCWVEHPQHRLPLGLDDQLVPGPAVLLGLLAQPVAELVDAVRCHARHVLHPAAGCLQRQGNRQTRHKVDVADVGKQLVAVEGELGEAEVDIGIWVAGVEDRGFDHCWPGVQEELKLFVAGKPDATAGDLGDVHRDGVARRAQRDGTVLCQGRPDGRDLLRVVDISAVGLEEHALPVILDGDAGDVCPDLARVGLVLQLDVQRVDHGGRRYAGSISLQVGDNSWW